MITIHKKALDVIDVQAVGMPEDAVILCVHDQHGEVTIWYELDDQIPHVLYEERIIYRVMTGGEVPSNCKHIGTVLQDNGHHVVHVYEFIGKEQEFGE